MAKRLVKRKQGLQTGNYITCLGKTRGKSENGLSAVRASFVIRTKFYKIVNEVMNGGSSEVDEVTEVIVNIEMVKCESGQLIKVVMCGVYSRTAMVCVTLLL